MELPAAARAGSRAGLLWSRFRSRVSASVNRQRSDGVVRGQGVSQRRPGGRAPHAGGDAAARAAAPDEYIARNSNSSQGASNEGLGARRSKAEFLREMFAARSQAARPGMAPLRHAAAGGQDARAVHAGD